MSRVRKEIKKRQGPYDIEIICFKKVLNKMLTERGKLLIVQTPSPG